MNKPKALIIAAMFAVASLAQAKDYHVVIRSKDKPIIRTEVFVGGDIQRDTITVLPADNITEIVISVKTLDGEVLLSQSIPFDLPEQFNFITPPMPEGFLLEIKDNNGTVYTGIEEEE